MEQVLRKIFRCPRTPLSLFTAFVLLVASICSTTAQERSRLDEVLQRGKLVVVTLGTVPPFAFKDEKGELVGFDIDVARLRGECAISRPQQD